MKISLVHIGLHKTATTTLQNTWNQMDNICLIHNEVMPLVQLARKFGTNQAKPTDTFKVKFPNAANGQYCLISNEGLSSGYYGTENGDVALLQKACAHMIYQIAPNAKILLTVRQPEKWLMSIYNQAVKEGVSENFPTYLQQKKEIIRQTLNIKNLVDLWGNFFGKDNLLILPIELLWENEIKFHSLLKEFAGVPLPTLTEKRSHINKSISNEHLKIMRIFNKYVNLFSETGIYKGSKNVPEQIKNALQAVRFALRWNLESPPDELEKILKSLAKEMPTCQIDSNLIEKDLRKVLRRHCENFIGDSSFWNFRDSYLK